MSIEAGGVNSVAVGGSLMAVAVENDDKQSDGVIAFYTLLILPLRSRRECANGGVRVAARFCAGNRG